MSRYRLVIAKLVALVVMAVIVAAYGNWAFGVAREEEVVRQQEADALAQSGPGPYAKDGVFQGSAEGYGGTVVTEVTIGNGWITSVEVVEAKDEDAPWLEMVEVLPERILEAQTSSIDVVSGATFTSTGILNGVTEALIASMEGASRGH